MRQQYLRNVVTLDLDSTKCTGCGRCAEVCPHAVFAIQTTNGRTAEINNRDSCMECGACAKNCASQALTVRAGVGCAWGIVRGRLTGREPNCGCGESESGSACCG
ncbi:MAG TPA: mercury methylation ferredoxin HgcB [Syntrophorhabdales bacterium]|nr:mercury methylation ferredoxin HgcB [Syntrophorhabdales bacterium]